MKRFSFVVAVILAAALAVSGCVSISKYTPPQAEEEKPIVKVGSTGKEQPKVKVEVELLERPDLSRLSAPKTPDTDLTSGNRGNFEGGILMLRKDFKAQQEEKPKVWWSVMPEEKAESEKEEPKAAAPASIKYKVKKGQTLADVSNDVYGTTKKWKKIYEANKDKIKDPNKIYAGQVLDIPQEESVKHLK